MFLSLKQRNDPTIDPDNILVTSGGASKGSSEDYYGGTAGEFSDNNPLSPLINATAGVDIGLPSGTLRASPAMQPTTTQDPTSIQHISTVSAGFGPLGAPALTPGPAAPSGSKPTTSRGIVDPFATQHRTRTAGAKFTPQRSHTGATFTPSKPRRK